MLNYHMSFDSNCSKKWLFAAFKVVRINTL